MWHKVPLLIMAVSTTQQNNKGNRTSKSMYAVSDPYY